MWPTWSVTVIDRVRTQSHNEDIPDYDIIMMTKALNTFQSEDNGCLLIPLTCGQQNAKTSTGDSTNQNKTDAQSLGTTE